MTGTAMEIIAWLSSQKDGQTFDCDFHKEKRSISANSLYWACVTEIAKAEHKPVSMIHNELLRQCGFMKDYDGEYIRVLLPDTDEIENKTLVDMNNHLMPVRGDKGRKIVGDKQYRWYMMLKHSADFDSKEMSILIDHTIEQMREYQLVPPTERDIQKALERMEKHK
jgi:hypothetical protein